VAGRGENEEKGEEEKANAEKKDGRREEVIGSETRVEGGTPSWLRAGDIEESSKEAALPEKTDEESTGGEEEGRGKREGGRRPLFIEQKFD